MDVPGEKVQKMARKRCPKCSSGKVIKKGKKTRNKAIYVRSANIILFKDQIIG